jgi:EAL domain-containing protein (putative c-di-GMP-specific phosphodiesterase class I)
VAVEALARWHHPRRGMMPPAEFIPAAERTGAVRALDQYVLREATRQARRWADAGTPVKVSVNVSATRFAQRDLPADVAAALAESGLSPEVLQLEITESALIEDVQGASRQLAELRRLGVSVAIDDFGAGQASLGYVSRFAIDTVKLDRSLVAGLEDGPTAGRLVGGFLGLFRSLGLHVVAEGVEDASQCARLTAAGCEMLQGFYIGRPAPAAATTGLLSRSSDARSLAAFQRVSAYSDSTSERTVTPPPVPSS